MKEQRLNLSDEEKSKLEKIAKSILSNNKGILATDERASSLEKRFADYQIENTEKNRKVFRESMFKVEGIEKFIGGAILNEETFDQKDAEGCLLTDCLVKKNIQVGVKLDKGLATFNESEKISCGLEDLEARIQDQKFKTSTFCKWRSLFNITKNTPSEKAIEANCDVLAKYGLIAQKNGKVPILEPEISFKGDFTAEEMAHVAKMIYSTLFLKTSKANLFLNGAILKISFIIQGESCDEKINFQKMGLKNVQTVAESVPPAIAGVVFLSGGHSSEDSFQLLSNLHKVENKYGITFSFSFARALTNCFLEHWRGKPENVSEAQSMFSDVLKLCNRANKG